MLYQNIKDINFESKSQHREHYYNDEADRHKVTIRIAKQREGDTGDITCWVNDTISDFRDDEPRGSTFISAKKEDYELPF